MFQQMDKMGLNKISFKCIWFSHSKVAWGCFCIGRQADMQLLAPYRLYHLVLWDFLALITTAIIYRHSKLDNLHTAKCDDVGCDTATDALHRLDKVPLLS